MMRETERKILRLDGYDYSQAGCYFVTICTYGRMLWFSLPVGAAPCGRPDIAAETAEHWLLKIMEKFPGVHVDKYVIMPNHIHVIFRLPGGNQGEGGHMGPPLPKVVAWYKSMTTNDFLRKIKEGKMPPFEQRFWQRSYHDHIIRDETDYWIRYRYIETNPARWRDDEYYPLPPA